MQLPGSSGIRLEKKELIIFWINECNDRYLVMQTISSWFLFVSLGLQVYCKVLMKLNEINPFLEHKLAWIEKWVANNTMSYEIDYGQSMMSNWNSSHTSDKAQEVYLVEFEKNH